MAILDLRDFSGAPSRLFVMRGRDILVDAGGQPVRVLPDAAYIKDAIYDTVTGTAGVELSKEFVPVGEVKFVLLRQFFAECVPVACPADRPEGLGERSRLPGGQPAQDGTVYKCNPAWAAARMKGYLNWRANVRFCPGCGAPLESHPTENAKVCPKCGRVHYPRIEPCVIAVICRGREILLLRHALRNQDIWCCLAGFVEAGESLEQALRREVKEETGLEIGNIRYAGSQSWPFPDQLMVGFHADYAGGEIRVQESEILEAKWFKTDDLPPHPAPGSISWNLIHFKPVTNK